MPDRLSPTVQLWSWPSLTPTPTESSRVPVRIGDAERDQAVSRLSDHFAAGRLTRDELDTRVDAAMAARFDADLRPLFTDLPSAEPPTAPAGPRATPARVPAAALLLAWLPILLVGALVTAVVLNALWLIWGFVWVLLLSSFLGRGRRRTGWGPRIHPGPYYRSPHYYRR